MIKYSNFMLKIDAHGAKNRFRLSYFILSFSRKLPNTQFINESERSTINDRLNRNGRNFMSLEAIN